MGLRVLRMEAGMSNRGEAGNREGSGAAIVGGKASGNRKGAESPRLKNEEWVMEAKGMEVRVTCCYERSGRGVCSGAPVEGDVGLRFLVAVVAVGG